MGEINQRFRSRSVTITSTAGHPNVSCSNFISKNLRSRSDARFWGFSSIPFAKTAQPLSTGYKRGSFSQKPSGDCRKGVPKYLGVLYLFFDTQVLEFDRWLRNPFLRFLRFMAILSLCLGSPPSVFSLYIAYISHIPVICVCFLFPRAAAT